MVEEARAATPVKKHVSPGASGLSRRTQRLLRAITLGGVIVIICAMTVAAEFGARHYERTRATPPDYFPSIFYPHRRLRYGLVPNLDYYGWFRINSLGFRGREVSVRKKPGTLRILCIGGSTTFDTGAVGRDLPWPEVLEVDLRRRLGVQDLEVLNLGIPGATSLDSLIDLEMRGLDLQPDLLVVYQAQNDFIYSIPSPAGSAPSDLFPQEDRPRGSLERWLTLHSLLYAKTEGRVMDAFERVIRVLPFASAPKGPPEDRNHAIEQGLASYQANLMAIAAIAGLHGVPLVLPQVIVPFASDAASESCPLCLGLSNAYGGLPSTVVRSTFDRYNGVLQRLGSQPGVHYIPTDGFVPATDRYYHDPVHFSPAGSIRMGQKLAEVLTPILASISSSKQPSAVE
ncbi:MAG: SGNH/GDSL hydrolase family protein [Gammaproteobacteria bacterium]